jgi:2-polyprenyl-6-methoxyphenol hydroxylase-like FAD-dependent oxidoreductase
MGRITQCVKDVIAIAKRSQDFGRAQQRIEQLFAEYKAAHRGHAAVAQRVKDQIEQAHSHLPVAAQQCLNQVLDWLDRDHMGRPPNSLHV